MVSGMTKSWNHQNVASAIQHTLIGTTVTREQVVAHAHECLEYGFQAAMVQGSWVDVVAAELSGTPGAQACVPGTRSLAGGDQRR